MDESEISLILGVPFADRKDDLPPAIVALYEQNALQKSEKTGGIPIVNFRLGPDALAELDFIAEHYSSQNGIDHNRTDAVKISIRREAERLRKEKKGGRK